MYPLAAVALPGIEGQQCMLVWGTWATSIGWSCPWYANAFWVPSQGRQGVLARVNPFPRVRLFGCPFESKTLVTIRKHLIKQYSRPVGIGRITADLAQGSV
jgi:hypothetical protein